MADRDARLDEALAKAVRDTGATAGGVYLLARDEPVLYLVVMCGVPLTASAPWRRLPVHVGPVSDAVREGRLVWVGCLEDMARLYPRTAAALPYRFALAAVPLTGTRRSWGALLLLWPASHPAHITRRERGHIVSSAGLVVRVLDAAPRPPVIPDQPRLAPLHHLGGQPPQLTFAAAAFAERLPAGGMALDLEGHVTFITTTAADLLGGTVDRLLGTLPWHSLPWLDNPVYEEHYRSAVFSREPVAYTVLRPPDRWLDVQLYPDDSGISALITPSDDQTPGRAAGTAGGSRVHQLTHLAAALTETVGVQDVIDLITDRILPAFGAQGMVIGAADAGRLKIIGFHGYAPELMERLDGLPPDTDIMPAGRVLASGTPAFFTSPEELARVHPQAPTLTDKQAWAILPLIVSGRPIGFCAITYERPHRFTADERAVLTALAGPIGQAVDRARLYDAKQELAHGLQEALLPRTLPTVPGLDCAARYLPASHGMDIGGDFYDLIRITDTDCAAVIGDVQGHNVTAAALMGQVRTAVHSHASTGASPEEVLARTNRVLADFDTDLFVSCLYAHLDLARRSITLTSAGHPPPILRRPGPRAQVLDIEPGIPLGISVEAKYPVITVPLPPGAILALYTDGLVEVPGGDITRTTAALTRYLADAGDLPLDHLIDSLIHHAWPTGDYTDDIAVLLLRTPG